MEAKRKVRIAGKVFGVVSDQEAEQCDGVVCMPWSCDSDFDDDVKSACIGCGQAIRHRPHVPKRPPKICIVCAPDWMNATRH